MVKSSSIKKIIGNSFAALLSVFILGFGQFVKGQWRWAAALYFIPLLINLIFEWNHLYDYAWGGFVAIVLFLGVWIFSIIHAYCAPFVRIPKWVIVPLFFIIPNIDYVITQYSINGHFPFVYGAIEESELYRNTTRLKEGELILFRRVNKESVERSLSAYWIFEDSQERYMLSSLDYSNRGRPVAQPLYVIWSSNFSRIGKRLDGLQE